MAARYISGVKIGASSRDTVSTRRIRVGDNNFPSRTALSSVSATFSAARSLSRWAFNCALRAFSWARWVALTRRTSFLADSLASSLARVLIARTSARRVARLFRLRNRPIPGRLPVSRGLSRCECAIAAPTLIGLGRRQPVRSGGPAGREAGLVAIASAAEPGEWVVTIGTRGDLERGGAGRRGSVTI